MNTTHQDNYVFSQQGEDTTPVVYGVIDGSISTDNFNDISIGPSHDFMDSSKVNIKRTIPTIIDKYINREVSGNLIYVNALTKIDDFDISSTNMKKTLSSSKSFSSQVTTENMTYIVQHVFDMNPSGSSELPTVIIPNGVTLEFTGGGFLKNCILFGNGATIKASKRIFENVHIEGIWNCPGDVTWFSDGTKMIKHEQWGYVFSSYKDTSAELQLALDSSFRELYFPPKYYYLSHPLILTKEKKIIMHGSAMKLSMGMTNTGRPNNCVIFSDQNINLLTIAVNENHHNTVYIEGGNFDVSLCDEYTESCIKILANEEGQKMWGVTINTNIKGRYNQTTGIGLDINPIGNYELTLPNIAFVTQIRINSNISDFGLGIKASDHGGLYNWCSDLVVDGAIINCPVAVESNCDSDIRAMIQSGKFFDEKENGVALIKLTSAFTSSVSSNIFDIRQTADGKWSNEFALETSGGGTVTPSGHFRAFYIGCNKVGWPIINGDVDM